MENQKRLPKMGLGALIFNEQNKLLLLFRINCDFYDNCWFIPCGKLESGETPREGIKREVKEETSLEVEVIEEIYNKPNEFQIPEVAYLCKILKGIPKITEPYKCKSIGYFSLDNLPENTGVRTLEIIEEYRRGKRQEVNP